MKTEYEATFWPVDPEAIRTKLHAAGAKNIHTTRLMRRSVFNLPPPLGSPDRWARVRDEGEKITMSVKDVSGNTIEGQREAMVVIDSYEGGVALLSSLGCQEKAYQETRRELWTLEGVEITIDEWPFLEPLVEIEGPSEAKVSEVAELFGLKWKEARFCSITALYAIKYGLSEDTINNHTPRIVFEGPNPFLKV